MPGKRKNRVSPGRWLADALLDLLDNCFSAIGDGFVALMHLLGRFVLFVLRMLFLLLRQLLRLLVWPFKAFFLALTRKNIRASSCLHLTGEAFEEYAAEVLRDNGFRHVELTPASGDQGVDILCERGGYRYAIQCKNYQGAVGNFAVQEAYAGMQYYGCDLAVVLCPGTFTASARDLAESTGVLLWGERRLTHMMQVSGRRP